MGSDKKEIDPLQSVQVTTGLINSKSKELESLQEEDGVEGREKERVLKAEINRLLEQEELKWKQLAKEEWLRHGDKNIKYFHECATQRSRNLISQIRNEEGSLCSTTAAIEEAFVRFFMRLFSSAKPMNVELGLLAAKCPRR